MATQKSSGAVEIFRNNFAQVVPRCEVIEIQVKAASKTNIFMFGDRPNLRDANLWSIEIFDVFDIPKSPSQIPLIDRNVMQNSTLTLQNYDGKEIIFRLPLIGLHTVNSRDLNSFPIYDVIPKGFMGLKINFPKSYIMVNDLTILDQQKDTTYLLAIYYSAPNKKSRKHGA